ncbi:DnaB-like helicase C-terminal domain-containing protein [Staphylococcus aureus]
MILAARPSVQVSSFALNIAQKVKRMKDIFYTVGIFSLEMGADQLATRMICSSNVDSNRLRTGTMTEEDSR